MSKYLTLYDVCADHPEAEKERRELCNDVITLCARVAELEKEREYDQRNAAMSQAESVKAYERIEELEAAMDYQMREEGALRDGLDAEREKLERLKTVLTEVRECAEYWSEYDVPVGIVDRMDEALVATAPSAPEASK